MEPSLTNIVSELFYDKKLMSSNLNKINSITWNSPFFSKSGDEYPKKGIIFRDSLEILQAPEIFNELIEKMSSSELFNNAEAIISVDARGFIFGSAISLKTKKPMIVARKPNKLPGELLSLIHI